MKLSRRNRGRWFNLTIAAAACAGLLSSGFERDAFAQLPIHVFARKHPRFAEKLLSPKLNAGKPARFVVPTRHARASASSIRLTDQFVVITERERDNYSGVLWSPPKRLLMDRVHAWVDTAGYREALRAQMPDLTEAGLGKGVTVGIVDGGIDLNHPDLRNADGTTRAAWLLSFSSGPLGFHPELEAEYGCTVPETPCAILSSQEINQVLNGELTSTLLPQDRLGHGTHVASIAAGGGQSDPAYRGMAPEASLIVALLAVDSVEVQDADVLLATKFVYERADEAGQPAVVNLSLGGDFGPHDGSTILERALVSLVDEPGRAMVVAAGNSGGTFADGPKELDGPFGIHRDVRVQGESFVSIAIPPEQAYFDGSVLIWIDTKPGESLAVGVESEDGTIVSPVEEGGSDDGSNQDWDAVVSNRASLDDESLADLENGTLVLLTGQFEQDEVLRLRLVGDAHAGLWVQGAGELSMTAGTRGPLFAMARIGGTITVPATASELVAVGATLNRTTWKSRDSGETELALFTEQLDDTPGSVGFFSSVGPNQLGNAKPNILAPGAAIIAAMAPSADPSPPGGGGNAISMFQDSAMCEVDPLCTVVDDSYAVAIGTSMASPVVSGAVALLLEQNPALTQAEVMQVLQAGVSRQAPSKTTATWEEELPAAPGLLNLPRTLRALELLRGSTSTGAPNKSDSWLTFADSYVSPGQTVEVQFWARTADAEPSSAESGDFEVKVTNGKLSQKLTKVGPGLFRLVAKANDDAPIGGGNSLEVRVGFDGSTLTKSSVAIAGDLSDVRGFARSSPNLRDESCGLASPRDSSRTASTMLGVSALVLLRRRRRRG